MILAGDIGGTRARLALYEPDGKKRLRQETYDGRSFRSLEAVLREFLGKKPPKLRGITLAVAGPVIGRRCSGTNFPWVVDAGVLERRFGWKRVHLINDLVGLALGAVLAPKSKLRSLSGGSLPSKKGSNIAILAAGTGLGEAALLWNGSGFLPMATEGGHTDMAARSETEVAFVRYLQKRYGRATYERALSGPGLGNTYDFVREAFGILEDPAVEGAIAGAKDRNAEICQLALAGRSLAAEKALEIFVELYGAEAGNLALKTFALGGVYVAGNIAIQIQEKMAQGTFLDAFCDKEPMKDILRKVPVALVLDSTIGLAGAAHHAAHTKIVA